MPYYQERNLQMTSHGKVKVEIEGVCACDNIKVKKELIEEDYEVKKETDFEQINVKVETDHTEKEAEYENIQVKVECSEDIKTEEKTFNSCKCELEKKVLVVGNSWTTPVDSSRPSFRVWAAGTSVNAALPTEKQTFKLLARSDSQAQRSGWTSPAERFRSQVMEIVNRSPVQKQRLIYNEFAGAISREKFTAREQCGKTFGGNANRVFGSDFARYQVNQARPNQSTRRSTAIKQVNKELLTHRESRAQDQSRWNPPVESFDNQAMETTHSLPDRKQRLTNEGFTGVMSTEYFTASGACGKTSSGNTSQAFVPGASWDPVNAALPTERETIKREARPNKKTRRNRAKRRDHEELLARQDRQAQDISRWNPPAECFHSQVMETANTSPVRKQRLTNDEVAGAMFRNGRNASRVFGLGNVTILAERQTDEPVARRAIKRVQGKIPACEVSRADSTSQWNRPVERFGSQTIKTVQRLTDEGFVGTERERSVWLRLSPR